MSMDTDVLFNETNIPTPKFWQEKIQEFGFDMEIYTGFNMLELSGFLPCTYKGIKGGFEYYITNVKLEDYDYNDKYREVIKANNMKATFSAHSSFRELAPAMICASVLTKITNSVYVECYKPEFLNGDLALEKVKRDLLSLEKELTNN